MLGLLSISFTFANRFIGEIRIKCGFIVQYESFFKKYLRKVSCTEQDIPKKYLKIKDKILSCILKIRYYLQDSILHITGSRVTAWMITANCHILTQRDKQP